MGLSPTISLETGRARQWGHLPDLAPHEEKKVERDEEQYRMLNMIASAGHLADLAAGGYVTEDATELRLPHGHEERNRFAGIPVASQVLWSEVDPT